jgi:hypothetical protein
VPPSVRARLAVAVSIVAAVLAVAAGRARGHVGAVVSTANFVTPPPPTSVLADAGRIVAPYTFATADKSYTISWLSNNDPTGRFVFWYMDHAPNFAVSVDQIEGSSVGAVKINDAINLAGGYFISCYCSPDAGVACPTDPRSPTGNCNTQLTWDTSQLPPGAYSVVAVNTDPPFHVYNSALAPVIVAHGSTAPPTAIFVRPDGYGAYDTSFRAQWIATGTPPLTFELAYGIAAPDHVLDPPLPVATNIMALHNSDGSFGFDWDVSKLVDGNSYYLRLTISDGNHISTFTDSYYAVQIFHGGGTIAGPPVDMSVAPPRPKKTTRSGCDLGGDGDGRGLIVVLLLVGAAVYFARRRAG